MHSAALVRWLAGLSVASCASLARLGGLRGGAAPPVQLIDAAGSLDAAAAAAAVSGAPEGLTLVSSVGAQGRGRRLLNELFGADFDTGATAGGAWLAASSSAPSVLLLATSGSSAGEAEGRSGTDAGTLDSFALALADAVLVHTPSTPSAAQLQASYERLFSQQLALGGEPPKKLLLVHVGEGAEKAVRAAAAAAWKVASAAAGCAVPFADACDLEHAPLPHPTHEADAYAAALGELRARLRGAAGALKAAGVAGAAEAAWAAACASLGAQPADPALCERVLTERAYDAAYAASQKTLAPWTATVAAGRTVRDFGAKAAALLDDAAATFEAGVADAPRATALAAQRGNKLRKAVHNDVAALFAKQHRLLETQQLQGYKAKLLKVVGRSGKLEAWQREGLQRQTEKGFDAALAGLFVGGLNGPSKQQLLDAFGKKLTAAATALQESPAMQLQAIGAVRRRTGKQPKPPRGFHVGLGVVGACHSKMGGGQGNLQTFAGYTAGLNSAHLLFANDGNLPDSSGSEPDMLRFQPKLNFDIAI